MRLRALAVALASLQLAARARLEVFERANHKMLVRIEDDDDYHTILGATCVDHDAAEAAVDCSFTNFVIAVEGVRSFFEYGDEIDILMLGQGTGSLPHLLEDTGAIKVKSCLGVDTDDEVLRIAKEQFGYHWDSMLQNGRILIDEFESSIKYDVLFYDMYDQGHNFLLREDYFREARLKFLKPQGLFILNFVSFLGNHLSMNTKAALFRAGFKDVRCFKDSPTSFKLHTASNIVCFASEVDLHDDFMHQNTIFHDSEGVLHPSRISSEHEDWLVAHMVSWEILKDIDRNHPKAAVWELRSDEHEIRLSMLEHAHELIDGSWERHLERDKVPHGGEL